MNKSNIKVRQFINNCKVVYNKPINPKENVMEKIAKSIDIKTVKGFTWKNMSESWGMAEADLLKTVNKETGSLRVLWYRSYKKYAMNVMKGNVDLEKANALLSQGLASLVRTGEYMYSDFAISDFAYAKDFTEFIESLNVIMFVEKASEFPKFQKSCEILGIKVLLQGSGRPNFSSTEYIYTHFFNGKVDEDHPIRILTLTDFDYDGVNPIAGGFIKQMKHYTPHVKVGRVGLESTQVPKNVKPDDVTYEVKQDNKNAPKEKWMENNLYINKLGRYMGMEVEAFPFAFYYEKIWDALKETGVTYQDYVNKQYEAIQPDAKAVAKEIATEMLRDEGAFNEIENQILNLQEKRSNLINDKTESIKNETLQVKNDPDFIRCQKVKGEESIYTALKNQTSWSGGLAYSKQRKEFKNRVKSLLEIK